MPIARLLTGSHFTAEQRVVLERAFNVTLRKLGLVDRNGSICEIVAREVIDIAGRCLLDDQSIAEMAARRLGSNLHHPTSRTRLGNYALGFAPNA